MRFPTQQAQLPRSAALAALLILTLAAGSPAARAAPATPTLPPLGCSTPLALTLLPGLREPNNHVSLPAAPDIPPGPVIVQVPLYPGAAASSLPMLHASYSYPASHYLKSVTAEYRLPTDWLAAESWYRQAFTACGYTEAGSSTSGVRGVVVSRGIGLRAPRQPPLQVELAFTPGPAQTTLVLYLAYTVALPPPAILVPGKPRAVTILAYRPPGPGQLAAPRPVRSVVVRNHGSIAALVRHLNALPRPQGVMSCPSDDGSRDVLLFAYARRPAVTVEVGLRGCRSVRAGNKIGLALSDDRLYALLAALLALPSGGPSHAAGPLHDRVHHPHVA